jgi:oligopeptide/dipeptide ABC transporter ATP-binding protein
VSGPAESGAVRPIISFRDVKKHFPLTGRSMLSPVRGWVKAVDGISLDLRPGQTLGIIGESGSGKTTLSRMLLLLEKPTEGAIAFEGQDVFAMSPEQRRSYRRQVQAVFQDPYSSLSPRMRVRDIILEPLVATGGIREVADPRGLVRELLGQVGLDPHAGDLYPHEFSGGQRQRIAVARALAVRPRVIVLDEPVSALDVSIRSQLLNLLKDLQARLGLSYILIAHDLSVVQYMSDEIAVMYLGKVVEHGGSDALCENPQHPYTQALLSAVLDPNPASGRKPQLLQGEIPSPLDLPAGCSFHSRCPLVMDRCVASPPALMPVAGGRQVRCHLAGDAAAAASPGREEKACA